MMNFDEQTLVYSKIVSRNGMLNYVQGRCDCGGCYDMCFDCEVINR